MPDLVSSPRFHVGALLSSLAVVWLASSIFSVPASAEHARNVSSCRNGLGSCDRSQLAEAEAKVDVAIHARNLSDCREGQDDGDYSLLGASEAKDVAGAERMRNYTARLTGRGYCDRSRRTASEAAKIRPDRR